MVCPKCDRIIIDRDEKGVRKLRTRILIFEETGTIAVCPNCKTRIGVPVIFDEKPRKPVRHFIVPK